MSPVPHPEQSQVPHLPRLPSHAQPGQFASLLDDESGQDMIEYVLVAALLGLVSITAVSGLGQKISTAYSSISSNLTSNT